MVNEGQRNGIAEFKKLVSSSFEGGADPHNAEQFLQEIEKMFTTINRNGKGKLCYIHAVRRSIRLVANGEKNT